MFTSQLGGKGTFCFIKEGKKSPNDKTPLFSQVGRSPLDLAIQKRDQNMIIILIIEEAREDSVSSLVCVCVLFFIFCFSNYIICALGSYFFELQGCRSVNDQHSGQGYIQPTCLGMSLMTS